MIISTGVAGHVVGALFYNDLAYSGNGFPGRYKITSLRHDLFRR